MRVSGLAESNKRRAWLAVSKFQTVDVQPFMCRMLCGQFWAKQAGVSRFIGNSPHGREPSINGPDRQRAFLHEYV